MRQIKNILQLLWSQGLSMRSIARSLGVAYGSVHEVLQRAEAAGVRWPLPEKLDDEALARLLYQGGIGWCAEAKCELVQQAPLACDRLGLRRGGILRRSAASARPR
jgi:hypothetical protein